MPCYQPLWAIPDINPRTGKSYLTKNGKTKKTEHNSNNLK